MMTKAAFATWDGRIAPVFDVARWLHVVVTRPGQTAQESTEPLAEGLPVRKALRLAELEVGVLVCGAISNPLQAMIQAYGIQVIPFVAGDLQEVVRAWLQGGLPEDRFAMPGCCGGRWRGNRGTGWMKTEEQTMEGTGGSGTGQAGGAGARRGGMAGRGRKRCIQGQGPRAAGAAGDCQCPQCGHVQPHKRGEPCGQKPCPRCGAMMTRQP